jgi:branched-subunit amino acid transport protein
VSAAWTVIVLVGAATVAIKGAGPLLVGGRDLPPAALRVLRLLAPALLCALVVTSVFGAAGRLVVDERAAGIAVALAALLVRAPMLVAVALAAAVTALVRAALPL